MLTIYNLPTQPRKGGNLPAAPTNSPISSKETAESILSNAGFQKRPIFINKNCNVPKPNVNIYENVFPWSCQPVLKQDEKPGTLQQLSEVDLLDSDKSDLTKRWEAARVILDTIM